MRIVVALFAIFLIPALAFAATFGTFGNQPFPPAPGPCTAASIVTHPSAVWILPGSPATLSIAASGTAPISYQWYAGTSGNLTSPIAGATTASVTVTPSATISTYWVHVSNSCNSIGVNSTTGVVTISATCPSPRITIQPQAVSAGIATTPTLQISSVGTSLHYQWYKGVKGDISTKVGPDSASFTTPAISANASYWVRIREDCGSFIDSDAAIVGPTRVHAARR
jgi:hypothetical protein